ncbi:MAG TPA: hypothetical protein PK801_13560 [Aggregatilineales bacterium]|jgi:hypothetical protein|nr:hypothetical protein [Aggregatilineales bacterium]HPV05660.1 hypothetical protein [Aggregatilineales bacterium]HQA69347.1 hypothetical protein [Aggregatilineales bacterium]HQE19668.1 hypothetical protein [Aggregatilineales bacterium]
MSEESNGRPDYELPENERPEDTSGAERPEAESIVAEFAALGKRFGEAIQQAWNSEERYQLQEDLKEGLDRFAKEVDEAIKGLRKSEVAQKVEAGAQQAAESVKSGKVGNEVRRATITALRSLSEALERMAASFTPREEADTGGEPGDRTPPVV